MGQKLGYEGCLILFLIVLNFPSLKIRLIFQLRYGRIFWFGPGSECLQRLIILGASTANLVSGQQKILRLYLIGAISSAASADSSFNRISPRNVTFSALEVGGHESEYNRINLRDFARFFSVILPSSVHDL